MVFSRRLSGDENRIGRNKFGVSGVLQNLFVATAARLCGHGGKNTVVCWFGLRAIAQAPHQPYGLSSPPNHCGTPSRRGGNGNQDGAPGSRDFG
jgi:hypothetical protein